MADLVVVGAGAWGLETARAALAEGAAVTVIDAAGPGAGASGGMVGALAPHRPGGAMTPMKALQIRCLAAWADHAAALEAETGIATGYARVGRLALLEDAPAREASEAAAAGADAEWEGAGAMAHREAHPLIAAGAAPAGLAWDDLTAKLWPPGYVAALAASVRGRGGRIVVAEALGLTAAGVATGAGEIRAGAVVIAAGWRAFGLAGLPGGGVKGQSALLAARLPEDAPVVTGRGLYAVRQGPDRVAVGSTAERDWNHEDPDERIEPVIARARAAMPLLAEAPVARRWAGIRPRGATPRPTVARLAGTSRAVLASGGFKIGLALAPAAGETAARLALGRAPDPLPAAAFSAEIERDPARL